MNSGPAPLPALHAALSRVCSELEPVAETATVPVSDAWGYVLARDLLAQADVPSFANSAVDGYAVRAEDCTVPSTLRVAGTVLAGQTTSTNLEPGTARRVMTGAPLPAGADAVVMRESTRTSGALVAIDGVVAAGTNVRARGEQLHVGEIALHAGTRLDPAAIGLATVAGATELVVARRLRVGIASTGDELVDPPAPLSGARSYDGNRPCLVAACRASGTDAADLGVCPDDAAAFAKLIDRARAERLDALLVSGGTALGDADVVRGHAAVRYFDLGIWPGRGFVFAAMDRTEGRLALFGLPGNAVATFLMFHLIALPALRHLSGARARVPEHVALPLAVDVTARPGRIEYLRARFERLGEAGVALRPLGQQGAAMLRTVVAADALVAIGGKAHFRAGEPVPAVLLASLPG